MLNQIKNSVYNPVFYKELTNKPWSFSVVYYLKLALLLALIASVIWSFILVPRIINFLRTVPDYVLSAYPAELELSIEEGQVSSNVEEPYLIDLSETLAQFNTPEERRLLVVIDTTTANPLATFEEYREGNEILALIGKDTVVYVDSVNEMGGVSLSVQALPEDLDLVINQVNIANFFDKLSSYFFLIPFVLVPALFAFVFVSILAFLVWLIFISFLLWVVYYLARDKGERFTFGQMYRLTMHFSTLGLISYLIFISLGMAVLPFLATVITIAVALINVPLIPKRKVEV